MLFTAAFHRNREAGIRTVEAFLYDSLPGIKPGGHKNNNGIRSRRQAGYWVCQDLWELKAKAARAKAAQRREPAGM